MLFKTYAPATLSSNCEKARAVRSYNTACRKAASTGKTAFEEYVKQQDKHFLLFSKMHRHFLEKGYAEYAKEVAADKIQLQIYIDEWNHILSLISAPTNSLQHQHVVYFIIFTNGGVKCGETNNFVQRYSNLNRENEIERAYYLPLDNKEEAKAAEHVLQHIFGHSRGMVQQMNKKDYFDCDHDYAVSFINRNKRKMYDAIMEVKGE